MKMKKTIAAVAGLLATTVAASAADMAVKARPIIPAEVWSWTGFYIGAHVGAGWGTTESAITGFGGVPVAFTFPFSQNSRSGFLGGGQIGANWQSGWAVFGVQGDIAGMNVRGTTPCVIVFTCSSESKWLASVTGRLGASVLDRGLIYVKGGGAWLNTDHSVNLNVAVPAINVTNLNSTAWGWTIGLGTEWMITRNWTAFLEYNYYDFDKKSETFAINPLLVGPGVNVRADLRNTLSTAKVGVNYKFDWGAPLVARY